MTLSLAENIRALRKERKMTQEALATVLGVTVGAVHKWEAGISVPELDMIVRMADFFDSSVDALLGYRMQDNNLDAAMNRIHTYWQTLDTAALAEGEKLLAKHPHSFRVVRTCANLFLTYGLSCHDRKLLFRALELLNLARTLLPLNDNPHISEARIMHGISVAYHELGEHEKALELMKKHNTEGYFSYEIGVMLALFMNRPEEAVPYLSETLAIGMINMFCAAVGYAFVYRARGEWKQMLDITSFCNELIVRMKTKNQADFIEKAHAEALLLLAYARRKNGQEEVSEETLLEAARLSAHFDSAPAYSLKSMRFIEQADYSSLFDVLGATAAESIGSLLTLLDDPDFTEKWKEISSREQ